GLVKQLEAFLADSAVEIFSDRDRDAVATSIPIKGKVTHPDAQVLPTVLGILRNAFVESLAEGFGKVPPPTAEKKQGLIEQAKESLLGGGPKTQPDKKKNDSKKKENRK